MQPTSFHQILIRRPLLPHTSKVYTRKYPWTDREKELSP